MEPVPCLACSTFFTPRNKLQNFCSNPDCQRVRKNLWQKKKLASDPNYLEEQRLAQKKWLWNNTDYWKKYRRKNQEKISRYSTAGFCRDVFADPVGAFTEDEFGRPIERECGHGSE